MWHISTRPNTTIYKSLSLYSLESVLSTSIISVLFTKLLSSTSTWYGSTTNPTELLGPTRFQWDNGYFTIKINRRSNYSNYLTISTYKLNKNWSEIPDKLLIYDYIGSNPAKGGLFRSGPLFKGDGVTQAWVGHCSFDYETNSLSVRRMPAFFETFLVTLVDKGGSVRADIAFRRAESKYSLDQTNISVIFYKGILNNVEFFNPSIVKAYTRKSQLGEIFIQDKKQTLSDGVFRTSSRGWYTFSHLSLSLTFLFGHIWHSSRSIFKNIWTGLSSSKQAIIKTEYGFNEKLGDASLRT